MTSLLIPSSFLWYAGLVRVLFAEEDADWILDNLAPAGTREDRMIWTPSSNGSF